jgi:hypothetical protein
VKNGGCLIYVGDDRDPYNAVHAWWNDEGRKPGTPAEALFAQLGIGDKARRELEAAGKGFVRVVAEDVEGLQTQKEGPEKVLGLVRDALKALGQDLKLQNYLRVQRGPFVVAAVMDESVSDAPLVLKGTLVDLFDPLLPVVRERALRPNERALLYDLDWAHKQGLRAKVVAAGARVGREALTEGQFTFVARGPKATRCNARILLPKEPARVALEPTVAEEHAWDAGSSTLFVSFENQARDVAVAVSF